MESAEYIVSFLRSFDMNIHFTYDMGYKCRLPFLDLLLTRNGNNIVTTVYRKTTNDLHLNLNSFAQTSWKSETLKTLIDCAYLKLNI